MSTLRPYQSQALSKVNDAHERVKRVCLVMPTGAGKSVAGREWVRSQLHSDRRVLVLAHRSELLRQFRNHLDGVGIKSGIISPEFVPEPSARVQIASMDTLVSRGQVPYADAILVDECFPAGTGVLMSNGTTKPIEDIEPGDTVHAGGVVEVSSQRYADVMVKLCYDGKSVRCTEEHPIFVKGTGYVRAKDLMEGDLLCVWRETRARVGEQTEDVRKEVSGDLNVTGANEAACLETMRSMRDSHWSEPATESDLQCAVSSAQKFRDSVGNEQSSRLRTHEEKQPNEKTGSQKEGLCNTKEDGSQTKRTRRKRERTNETRVNAIGGTEIEGRKSSRCNPNSNVPREWLPYPLQDRSDSKETETGDRSGRKLSLRTIKAGAGQAKDLMAHWARLDSVEIQKLRSGEGHGFSSRPLPVYNLQTKRGCYVAGRILVHNCHHIVSKTWQPIVESLPEALVLGLTATPQRSDGKPLGDVFQELVVGAQYSQLLELGHICRVKILRPERYLGSDFAQEPADAWEMHAKGKKGFAFCRTVKECKALAQTLRERGIPAAHLDGKTSVRDRIEIMRDFRSGKIQALCNVYVLTEGVDVPDAEVCMLARSPQHAGTYMQMVGRVLRPSPTKPHAILIDLPGCSHPDKHGAPTADREYALTGKAIATTGEPLKNCPMCGMTESSSVRVCSECDYRWPVRTYDGPKIWNLELMEFFHQGGEIHEAPKQLKQAEFNRLLAVCDSKGYRVAFAVSEFEKMFSERPNDKWVKELPDEVKTSELRKLLSIQQTKKLQIGWISHGYKAAFGSFPSRKLREAAGVPMPVTTGWGGK